mmetsp:Transcript_40422/g.46337  ORF Transcript_40422/g.46337 Transcript_40422/m.46337 type:complete len:133 (+) Transcript_40422:401-799(+)
MESSTLHGVTVTRSEKRKLEFNELQERYAIKKRLRFDNYCVEDNPYIDLGAFSPSTCASNDDMLMDPSAQLSQGTIQAIENQINQHRNSRELSQRQLKYLERLDELLINQKQQYQEEITLRNSVSRCRLPHF